MIDELIERVEKGEGADRELEIAVWRQFNDAPANREPLPWLCCYTESIDAVTALIKERLPGAFGDVDLGALPVDQSVYGARLFSANWDPWKNVAAEATSPARALLAAFLRAHKEQHDG